jgi:murein DD-endopeptidase MepM/ murein hydrolase activator NlpD
MNLKICYPLNPPFPINQRWNEHPEYYNKIGMKGHNGWDFCVQEGTPVYATHDGFVNFAGIDGTMSKTIMIDTNNEGKEGYRTACAHLSEYFVSPGQKVKRGELIGKTGNTGRYTSGPHLHFGIKPIFNYSELDRNNGYNGCVDPAPFFDGYYPKDVVVTKPISEKFLAFQKALQEFQVSENIMDFANEKDLAKIKIGNKTLTALKKYQK